ncbi:MAG: poly-beta-1,6-N-acetyl-D-glucosamine biosynthesis protein PgaD [Deltaproteobacteria bacterium]|jgi:poly-beta-1,6-N-acetyl-D-glucosamine biosynthesis protein PgaD|nr:poly-beta-1,6-N-acetyl-D-glucosamine biosynthesis protein PgaD [Deltaproteobacteria bacterium]MDH4008614.1 poly-beta-1,6-N-acetyl-D-glucosamine biosynthesis protein PgaD [Desulfuromonadales bacterium]
MPETIINRPDLQSFQQKYGQSLITVLFWVLFFFFMRPLIGMVGWIFGIQLFTDIMIERGGYHALFDLLTWYAGIVVLIGLVLGSWSLYNLYRYGRNEKRKHHPQPVQAGEISAFFHVDPNWLNELQASKKITLEHDAHGRLINSGEELDEVWPRISHYR